MNKSWNAAMILGGAVILIGVLMLIKNIFGIHIPVFTIVISLGLIWLGVMLIKGSTRSSSNLNQTMFSETNMRYNESQDRYSVLFGSGTLNLQDLRPDKPLYISAECTFGELKVIVSRETPLYIDGNSAFGNLGGPDLQTIAFGNYRYTSPDFNPSMPGLTLHCRVQFGELRIFYI